jgi:hypothetical protein
MRVWGSDHGAASAGWRGEGMGRRARESAGRRAWDGAVLPPWRRVPVVGMVGRWVEVRDDLLFSIFIFIGLTSGPLSMLAHIEPTQHL